MIPLATTTVTVATPAAGEPYEGPPSYTTRLTSVRAHIGFASAFDQRAGGGQEAHDAALLIDVAVQRNERVTDNTTGQVWYAGHANARTGLGLDHFRVGLYRTSGAVPG